MRTIAIFFLMIVSFYGCREKPNKQDIKCVSMKTLKPTYAKGFEVKYYNGFKVVSTFTASQLSAQYVIYPLLKKRPIGFESAVAVPDSLFSICLLSTSQIAATALLSQLPLLKAVANPSFIYNQEVQRGISAGAIVSIGHDYQPDIEKLIKKGPQLLFTDGEYASQSGVSEKLKMANIAVIKCQDYKENSPLARAEWIKFYGAIFNQEKKADSIFEVIEKNYLATRNKLLKANEKPTVFCNFPYQGVWYIPAKGNYNTQLFEDACTNYLWAKSSSNNGFNLSLNFEEVFSKAKSAEYWILFSPEKTLRELNRKDEKLAYFESFKKGQVFSVSKRVSSQGGVDYWESGIYRPDLILHDLGIVFHQSLFEGDSTSYFKRLEP